MLLADSHAAKALKQWELAELRLGSKLLLFECQVVIHRCVARMHTEVSTEWSKNAQEWLSRITKSLILHEIDDRVRITIEKTPKLGACRTLDAIHLGTALIFQSEGATLEVSSFDARLNEAATNLELQLCG